MGLNKVREELEYYYKEKHIDPDIINMLESLFNYYSQSDDDCSCSENPLPYGVSCSKCGIVRLHHEAVDLTPLVDWWKEWSNCRQVMSASGASAHDAIRKVLGK